MQQKRLRSGRSAAINCLFVSGGLQVDRLDTVVFGRRQVRFWAGPFVCGECVGQRSGVGLPNTTFDALLVRQGETDRRGKVSP
jgi:hypothetical protein